jgi:ATP-binding cassette subfamily B protein
MNSPKEKRTVFGVYSAHAFKYPWRVSVILVTGLIMQAANLVGPLYLRQFFNILAKGTPDDSTVQVLLGVLAIIVFAWFVDWVAHRAQYISAMYLEEKVMSDLYSSAFDYLLGHSHNFFTSRFAGSLTHKVNKFARAFETLFETAIVSFFPMGIFIVGAVIIVFTRNHVLGATLAIWTLLFLAFQLYVSSIRQPARDARAKAESHLTGNLADAISNQSTITLFVGARYEAKRFAKVVHEWILAYRRTIIIDAWIWLGIGLFIIAIQTIILYVGVHLWRQGLFTVGDFVLIQTYLFTTFTSLERLNRELRRANDAYSDAAEMVEMLDTLHEIGDAPHAKVLAVSEGVVEFKHANFHFHEEKGIFEDFNLRIEGGEKVALVGPSGAGKSTITKLILRLFDVKSGAIEIDGQDISKVTQESLRAAISFVPQEPILFHRTLMENIRYGRRDATDEEVIEAAKQAHCHEFISSLSHRYDTYVGERGIKLSGGERQRVAIARAILKNAPILMLDEATSSLDSGSELLIQDALEKLMRGKTVLVIAHRLSTIAKMDRIIALDQGKVVEEGTHSQLIEKGGIYSELWNHQAGGFLQD